MDFDIHTLRGVMSGLILLVFIALFVWVAVGGRDRFREAAELPFADEDTGADRGARRREEAGESQA